MFVIIVIEPVSLGLTWAVGVLSDEDDDDDENKPVRPTWAVDNSQGCEMSKHRTTDARFSYSRPILSVGENRGRPGPRFSPTFCR
jgi:hypothetical protein